MSDPACGRRTCDRDAAVQFTTRYGAIRVRCDEHALADAVVGVGDTLAEAILASELTLPDLLDLADRVPRVLAATLATVDGIGRHTGQDIAENLAESPLSEATLLDENIDEDSQETPAEPDGGVAVDREFIDGLQSLATDVRRLADTIEVAISDYQQRRLSREQARRRVAEQMDDVGDAREVLQGGVD